jgi:hypothetical protein
VGHLAVHLCGPEATEEGEGEEDWILHGSALVWVELRGFAPFPESRLGECCYLFGPLLSTPIVKY